MSRSRQQGGPDVRTHSVTYASGYTWRARRSDWAQLLFASRGAMTVHTAEGLFIVPPHQAVWVPAGVRHDVEMAGSVPMRALYISDRVRRRLPTTARVVDVSPLLRELLRRTIQLRTLDRRKREERHLLDVLLDQLALLPVAPIGLPSPRDPRAIRAATVVRATPEAHRTTAMIARDAGASARTLERLFRSETGMSFGAWRQRVRLLRALQVLAEGASVTKASLAVGYESTSAFVAAFRRAFGTTPGRYFRRVDREID